ncbi:CBS domain-containing protein [Shewanella sp. 10N.7]|uniref:CBS domain-containing protein n=1 Tax=Shewanella sp. 10N.7 TaxID=2885093 RepID=UPI001E2DC2CB|nr:CBS domain-containing protein [Shewanella sp. 10N.7]MCC4831077.1 CBS domain-containing protein [Shewanella sp. 10N.7]
MRNLELFSTASIDHLLWSSESTTPSLDSSALEVFTDFDVSRPIIVDASTSAIGTAKIMEKTHAYMRLVVDKNNKFLGIITQQQLSPHNLMITANRLSLTINELMVTEIMVPREELQAFDYNQISTAKVSDIVRLLKENNLHHMLVIDQDLHHIRGLIAASDLARKLKQPIQINQRPSFSQVAQAH